MTTIQECFIKDVKNAIEIGKRIEVFIDFINKSLPDDPKTIDLVKKEFKAEKSFILEYIIKNLNN